MRQLTVDPEFREKIPPLSDEEFAKLEENILADGEVREPLVVWKNTIIDGHHRWKIILKHQKKLEGKFKVKQMEFPDKWAAIVWMCRNQLGRRNLTDEQRFYLRGKQYEAEKMTQGTNNQYVQAKSENGQNVHFQSRREQQDGTAGRIGRENGVDGRTIRRDADFADGVDMAEKVSPGIKDAILSGEVKAPKTMIAEIRNLPEEKQKEVADAIKKGDIFEAKAIIQNKPPDRPAGCPPDPPSPQPEEDDDGFTAEDMRSLVDDAIETLRFTLEQHLVQTTHLNVLRTKEGQDTVVEGLKIGHSVIEKYMNHVRSVQYHVK